MRVSAIKTKAVLPRMCSVEELLDEYIPTLAEKSVVAVTSKVVALCEGRAVPVGQMNKDDLVHQEAQYYLPAKDNPYGVTISVTRGNLVASGGVDESNGAQHYVLWPKDLQLSVNTIREHLASKHQLKEVGVILTDSTTKPFQWGTTGLAIAYSGFEPLHSYVGEPDVFGREMRYQKANIKNGLAVAAVLAMGEGAEQTPLAIIEDVDFVKFVSRNPTEAELEGLKITKETDLFSPLLQQAPWQKGLGI